MPRGLSVLNTRRAFVADPANRTALAGTPPGEGNRAVQGWTLPFYPLPVGDGFRDFASLRAE